MHLPMRVTSSALRALPFLATLCAAAIPACARGNESSGGGGEGGSPGVTTGPSVTTGPATTSGNGGAGGDPTTSSSSASSSSAQSSSAQSSSASSSSAQSSSAQSSGASSSAAQSSAAASSAAHSSAASSSAASSSASSGTGGGSCPLGHLVISEIRSRGVAGGSDEFVELWNPTGAAVTLGANWVLEGRSATAAMYNARWTGSGLTIPAHGHFLLAGSAYAQLPAPDEALLSGITDATSLRLMEGTTVVDALCYAYSASTTMAFSGAMYTCEGAPVSNLPHNDGSGAGSNVDASLERNPGGLGGSCVDTGDNASDFAPRAPAGPESTQSPPTP